MPENILNDSNEITLKEFLVRVRNWMRFISNKWKFICAICIIGGVLGFMLAIIKSPIYKAKTSFVLEEGKSVSSNLGGLASLAGQFGVDVGGNSNLGLLSGENIILYFKSPTLAREVLLSQFDGMTKKSIADVYVDVYGLNKKWSKNKQIGFVNFPILGTNKPYSRIQDSLIQEIIFLINESHFSVSRTDKKAGFIDVICSMQDETLAKKYCERIVQRVVEKYLDIKTQKQKATVDKLQARADSLYYLLQSKTMSGARLQNSSNTMDINPLFRTGTLVAVETTQRDKTLLSTIFASVIQNLELAKFTLSQETPVIQIVDAPILPLKVEKPSVLKYSFIGFFVFGFLYVLIISTHQFYISIMR